MKKLSLGFALLAFIFIVPLSPHLPQVDVFGDSSYSSAQHYDQYLTSIRPDNPGFKDFTGKSESDLDSVSSLDAFTSPAFKVFARHTPWALNYAPNLISGGFGNRAGPLAVI